MSIIILAVSSVLVGAITLVYMLRNRADQAKKRAPSPEQFLPPDIQKAEGINFHRQFQSGSKNSSPSIHLTIDLSFPAPIRFSAESGLDRFGKAIGLASEYQTQDGDFDREIYLDCAYHDYAAAMLGDSSNRLALRRCFALVPKLAWIQLGDKKAVAVVSPAGKHDLDEQMCKEGVACVAGLQEAVQGRRVNRNTFKERMALVVITVSSILSVLSTVLIALGLAFFSSLDNAIFIPGILGGMVFFLLYAAGSYFLLKGKPGTLVAFILALGLGLTSGITGGIGAVHLINGIGADQPLLSHVVAITGKSISRGKSSTSYYLDYVSWKDGQGASISVAQSWYDAREVGDSLVIETRVGSLGFEYLVAYRDIMSP